MVHSKPLERTANFWSGCSRTHTFWLVCEIVYNLHFGWLVYRLLWHVLLTDELRNAHLVVLVSLPVFVNNSLCLLFNISRIVSFKTRIVMLLALNFSLLLFLLLVYLWWSIFTICWKGRNFLLIYLFSKGYILEEISKERRTFRAEKFWKYQRNLTGLSFEEHFYSSRFSLTLQANSTFYMSAGVFLGLDGVFSDNTSRIYVNFSYSVRPFQIRRRPFLTRDVFRVFF